MKNILIKFDSPRHPEKDRELATELKTMKDELTEAWGRNAEWKEILVKGTRLLHERDVTGGDSDG